MTYIDNIWEDKSHISIDSDDALMLGFDVPWKVPRKEVRHYLSHLCQYATFC